MLLSVRLSVRPSVAYFANNSRTQRPSVPKFGTKLPHASMMRLAHQFQGQTVKSHGYRRAGAYRVGRTRRPHCLFLQLVKILMDQSACLINLSSISRESFCSLISEAMIQSCICMGAWRQHPETFHQHVSAGTRDGE